MKSNITKEQKINLIDCEEIQLNDNLQNNTSQIKCDIPVNIEFEDEKLQVVNIDRIETIIEIKTG